MAAPHTPPAWRGAFLRELARTGSVTRAAELAAIDRTSAYQARRCNPAFALSWDRALATARERSAPLRPREGEVVRQLSGGRSCLARAGAGRWSARAEAAFLTELAASANVAAATRACGVSRVSVYNRRRLDAGFAAVWDAALRDGYTRLEALLLHAATAALDPEALPPSADTVPASFADGLNLLKLHRAGVHGGKPQRYGWRRAEPDIEEVRAEVLRRLAAMDVIF